MSAGSRLVRAQTEMPPGRPSLPHRNILRGCRDRFLFASEIPANVAHIFALQGQRLVLRMTLEENELAGLLPGEDVDAGAFRHRQHLVASCPDLAFVQPVQARVGNLERGRQILGQPAFAYLGTVVNARALFRQASALDAVEVQYRGVSCKAGPDRGKCVCLRPIDDFGQSRPIGLLGKRRRTRFGAGDNQAIDLVR